MSTAERHTALLGHETLGMVLYFLKTYPGRSMRMVACLLVSGVVEGLGIAAILPLVAMATGVETDSSLARAVATGLGVVGLEPTLGVLLTFVVVGMAFKGLFLWLALNHVGYAIAQCAADLRLELIDDLLHARWSYFTSQPTGDLAAAISREATVASNAYRNTAMAIASLIQVAVYATLALLVSWQTALLALAAGGLITLILHKLVEVTRRAGHRQTVLVKSLLTRMVDALNGIKPIKAMARDEHLMPFLQAETQGLNEAQRLKVIASQSLATFQEPLLVLIMAIGLFVALRYLTAPFATLLVLAFLFSRIVNQVNVFLRYVQALAVGESAFWSLREAMQKARSARETHTGRRPPPPLEEGIELDNVSFAYDDQPVLRGVSCTIPSGRLAAIIGPSGCGKTTLADLLLGLHHPAAGVIRVDGIPFDEIDLRAWRRTIGYVPQEMFLFHDTIEKNVTLGDPALDTAAINAALQAAGAWEFIEALPDGIHTIVGEHGSKLSGGQRQRIALARALAARPRLLILDEVTTALDPETEAAICRTLAALRGRATIVAISHQPAVVNVADVVYRLANGSIAE